MLRIPTDVPAVITKHTHPLDAFQKQAVYAIQHDENVLVTAKTGSGHHCTKRSAESVAPTRATSSDGVKTYTASVVTPW